MRSRQYQILVAAATIALGLWFLTLRLHDMKPHLNQGLGIDIHDSKFKISVRLRPTKLTELL